MENPLWRMVTLSQVSKSFHKQMFIYNVWYKIKENMTQNELVSIERISSNSRPKKKKKNPEKNPEPQKLQILN